MMSEIYLYDEISGEKWTDFDGTEHGFTPNDMSEGLKEAKELVDSAPKVIKEQAAKAQADELKAKLEAEGAKVTLK